MKLVIGGSFQGKLTYVLGEKVIGNFQVFDGVIPGKDEVQEAIRKEETVIINHVHQWVRNNILQGGDAEKEIMEFADRVSDSIVISDEIGSGIVPADSFEREYRERAGRILVKLAEQADEVVRVICGIGQKIK